MKRFWITILFALAFLFAVHPANAQALMCGRVSTLQHYNRLRGRGGDVRATYRTAVALHYNTRVELICNSERAYGLTKPPYSGWHIVSDGWSFYRVYDGSVVYHHPFDYEQIRNDAYVFNASGTYGAHVVTIYVGDAHQNMTHLWLLRNTVSYYHPNTLAVKS